MNTEESLKTFGTVSLSLEWMKSHIRFGTPIIYEDGGLYWVNSSELCLAVWLATVPDLLRDEVTKVAIETVNNLNVMGQKQTDRLLDLIISAIHHNIVKSAETQTGIWEVANSA